MTQRYKFAKVILVLVLCFSMAMLATGCAAKEYTVTFDANGGSAVASQTVQEGEMVNLFESTKQGFIFDGWYEGESKVASPYVVKKDVTLKAKWTEETPAPSVFTVTFDTDGGTPVSSIEKTDGEMINLPSTTKTGFVFLGWYDGETPVSSPYVVNKNVTLKASWLQLPAVPQPCTVNFNVDGGNPIVSLQQYTGDVIGLPLPTKEGYVFDSWYVDSTKVTDTNYTLTGDVTFTAKWMDKNPAYDYNYYAVKYNFSKSSKIQAINFSDLDEMMTINGEWVIFIDSESDLNAQERFQMINDFAHEWGITIHHFNPDLSGGYASHDTNAHTTNLLNTLDEVSAESQLNNVQQRFNFLMCQDENSTFKQTKPVVDHTLISVKAQPSTARWDGPKYVEILKSQIVANENYTQGAKVIAAVATRKPGVSYTSTNPTDYDPSNIDVFNGYADDRWHMVDDQFTEQKQDVFINLANYAQFSHLLNQSDGVFVVIVGGVWCPNTTAVAKITNDIAKDYGIDRIYNFNPRLEGGTRIAAMSNQGNDINMGLDIAFLAANLQTRKDDALGVEYNFNYLYANLIRDYFSDFVPKWEHSDSIANDFTITSNGVVDSYSRMYTPTVLLFDGSGAGPARVIDYIDAEYYWDEIKGDNSPAAKAWSDSVKALFDKNEYASYHPLQHAPAIEITQDVIMITGGAPDVTGSGGDSC
ncbi:MAG: InlB B-repeat-containing protein [Clostridia bacterium]|nr:InlB B-repeat-containing protein [Clostridia bacterium]